MSHIPTVRHKARLWVALMGLALAPVAFAQSQGYYDQEGRYHSSSGYSDQGHVVCRDVPVQQSSDTNHVAGTAIGAIVGGVVGNQIGHGSGRTLATVGGAVAGGYVGNRVQANNQARNTTYQHQCWREY